LSVTAAAMSGSSRDWHDFHGMFGGAQGCGNASQAVRSQMI